MTSVARAASGLDTPLTPLHFLVRSADVHPTKLAVIDGGRRLTYAELAAAVRRLARAPPAPGGRAGGQGPRVGAQSAGVEVVERPQRFRRQAAVGIEDGRNYARQDARLDVERRIVRCRTGHDRPLHAARRFSR